MSCEPAEPKNTVRWVTWGVGRGYTGYWKIALNKMFSLKKKNFPPHNVVVLFSTYDVDFMILFLKKWYFSGKKN